MNVLSTGLSDVLILEPTIYKDERGFFFESFNKKVFHEIVGGKWEFVQDNLSRSTKGVLRGLHYQIQQAQGKLVQVLNGTVFDVVIDIRKSSPSFGQWVGIELSADNKRQVWIPPGFAHGFLVLSETADFYYKVTNFRASESERSIRWNDPQIAIEWPNEITPLLSPKDGNAPLLKEAEIFS
ncbi:MAG: dTDP-4-dehydrorhamnose 3,5-epimerase [Proteobacteria bacterium]|nr:dTDP-4-dehydrorhamnose 3,5-epimerase [Pseudomonadota bacterium]